MARTRNSIVVFSLAGFVSGLASGASVLLPPLSMVAPGLLFGIAISHSFHATASVLSSTQRIRLIVASTIAFLIAIVATMLSSRLPGFDNGLFYSAIAGGLGGTAGAFVLTLAIVLLVQEMSPKTKSASH
jgi:hypothetical protein